MTSQSDRDGSRRRFLKTVGVTAGLGAVGSASASGWGDDDERGNGGPGNGRGRGRGHDDRGGHGFGHSDDSRIVGYYTSWSRYARGYMPADVPLEKLTHLQYAFLNVEEDGTVVDGDSWAESQNLPALRQRIDEEDLDTKLILSIGGWTFSKYFSNAALNQENRERFASSAIEIMREYDCDGLDVDWEYPGGGGHPDNVVREGDAHRFTLLLEEVRNQLDAAEAEDGQEYELAFAASADPAKIDRLEHEEYEQYVDAVSVMAYDFHGSFSEKTGFNAPLYQDWSDPTTDADQLTANFGMQYWADTAIPRHKLNMGAPFYGRGFADVPDENDGLHQPFDGVPSGTWAAGSFDFWDLNQNYLTDDAYERHWHRQSNVPWLYNEEEGVFISYDDADSIGEKAEYVQWNGFGGMMVWELSADKNEVLLDAIREEFDGPPFGWAWGRGGQGGSRGRGDD